jgi:hypothetical protein
MSFASVSNSVGESNTEPSSTIERSYRTAAAYTHIHKKNTPKNTHTHARTHRNSPRLEPEGRHGVVLKTRQRVAHLLRGQTKTELARGHQ